MSSALATHRSFLPYPAEKASMHPRNVTVCPLCKMKLDGQAVFVAHVIHEHGKLAGISVTKLERDNCLTPIQTQAIQPPRTQVTPPARTQVAHPARISQSQDNTIIKQTQQTRKQCTSPRKIALDSLPQYRRPARSASPDNSTPNKQFQCAFCGRTFSKKYNKNVHETIVHKKDYDFKCSICGESFPLKQSLRSHILRHKGIKPFVCSKCGVGFIENKNLKRHLRSLHDQHCDECEKVFISKAALRRHHKDCHFTKSFVVSTKTEIRVQGKPPRSQNTVSCAVETRTSSISRQAPQVVNFVKSEFGLQPDMNAIDQKIEKEHSRRDHGIKLSQSASMDQQALRALLMLSSRE